MKILRVENIQLNCLFTRLNRQEIKKQKKNHKWITTTPPLTSDAMSPDDSKDERNNATAKSGGQGYLSKDDYQSRCESSQGKQDNSQRDEKLKAELKALKKLNSKSTKGDIRNANDWTSEEANLADEVFELCKDFLLPCYKFLKDGWMEELRTREQ